MSRAALTLVLVFALAFALAAGAHAQQPPPASALPAPWRAVHAGALTDLVAITCTRDHAYARSWGGRVASFDGSTWTALPELPGSQQGHTYGTAIAAAPTGEVFTEASGTIAAWDGHAWTSLALDGWTQYEPIGGVFAASATDVYVTGRGKIARRNGAHFVAYDAGTWRELTEVAGTGSADLWTSGQGGTIQHWDGAHWTRAATGAANDVWYGGLLEVSATDVWAWRDAPRFARASHGGNTPAVLHFDGHAWTAADDGLDGEIAAVAGDVDGVYAVTTNGVAHRTNGAWVTELHSAERGPDAAELIGGCTTAHALIVVDDRANAWVRPRE